METITAPGPRLSAADLDAARNLLAGGAASLSEMQQAAAGLAEMFDGQRRRAEAAAEAMEAARRELAAAEANQQQEDAATADLARSLKSVEGAISRKHDSDRQDRTNAEAATRRAAAQRQRDIEAGLIRLGRTTSP